MEEIKYYVYKHLNPKTKEVFYVGIGYGSRAWNKDSRNKFWKNYVYKYGLEVEIFSEKLTRSQASHIEIDLIKKYGKRINNTGTLVNICDGGEGNTGYNHSEEWKRHQSIIKTGKKLGPLSEEAKQKLSKKLSGRNQPTKMKPILQFDKLGNFIKEWDSQTRIKTELGIGGVFEVADGWEKNKTAGGFIWIFKDRFSKKLLEEKIKKANSPKKSSPIETGYKISKKLNKPVLQYDSEENLIKEWSSIKEAAKFYNIHSSNIGNCCRNTQKTSNGFIWKFKN